jgi:hypothetical protein
MTSEQTFMIVGQRLIRERGSVDDRRLADPDVPLDEPTRVGGGTAA